MKGEINVGATIFTFVFGLSIAAFFAWTNNNGQRRDREIALGIYPGIKKERAGGDVKSDAKLSAQCAHARRSLARLRSERGPETSPVARRLFLRT